MNRVIAVNPQKYGRLLAKVKPAVIQTEEENERVLSVVSKLMSKGEKLTPEEAVLLKLLGRLVKDFEEHLYQLDDAAPHEVLKELMDARGLKQNDISKLLGSKARASEVLNGKRAISKAQAKTLAEFFSVSAELFI
jgi:HTH-type transcriptional regulator/antitoxin HigA